MGAPGVPLANIKDDRNTGTGFVALTIVPSQGSSQVILSYSLILNGRSFGSRFGHAVQFIDVNGDG